MTLPPSVRKAIKKQKKRLGHKKIIVKKGKSFKGDSIREAYSKKKEQAIKEIKTTAENVGRKTYTSLSTAINKKKQNVPSKRFFLSKAIYSKTFSKPSSVLNKQIKFINPKLQQFYNIGKHNIPVHHKYATFSKGVEKGITSMPKSFLRGGLQTLYVPNYGYSPSLISKKLGIHNKLSVNATSKDDRLVFIGGLAMGFLPASLGVATGGGFAVHSAYKTFKDPNKHVQ